MKLTIGMIVKNEQKHLEKCLLAIEPLRRAMKCELIITDTGSNDKTLEIANKYADKVTHFEWCDDFAAARNANLKLATGDWYFQLDADEYLDSDITDLLRFFKNGKYKKYTAASLDMRSYETDNITYAVDCKVRLHRIGENTEYVGTIHEIIPPTGMVYEIKTILHHYGYAYENKQARLNKIQRNLTPLLAEYEKNPDERNSLHLAQQYFVMGKYAKCLKVIKTILPNVKSDYLLPFYAIATNVYKEQQNLQKIVDLLIPYFNNITSPKGSTEVVLYYNLANAQFALENYEQAKEACERYFKLFYLVESNKFKTVDYRLFSSPVYTRDAFDTLLVIAFLSYVKLSMKDKAIATLKKLSIMSNTMGEKNARNIVTGIVMLSKDATDFSYALDIIEDIKRDKLFNKDRFRYFINEFYDKAMGNAELLKIAIDLKNEYNIPATSIINADMKPILTVGMIVKNEHNHLRRCLEALRPLLAQVPSELVITDTGSTDDTLAIASEYTDKVYHFEWCDDFAAARNANLEKAQGEWYFQLDADEYLDTNIVALVNYFNNNTYKDGSMAGFIMRNYTRGNFYVDAISAHIFKIFDETSYKGRIHEAVSTPNVVDILDFVVHHYGYNIDDTDTQDSKTNRNLSLLLLEYNENKTDTRTISHLANEYNKLNRYSDTIELIGDINSIIELEKDDSYKNILNIILYQNLLAAYLAQKDYQSMVNLFERYSKEKQSNEDLTLEIDLYYLAAAAYSQLGLLDSSIQCCENFIRLVEKFDSPLKYTSETAASAVLFISNKDEVANNLQVLKKANKKKYKITIGMIVKNEQRYLSGCLDNLKQVMDKINCELVITDTGSTDDTLIIAHQYTNKVYHYDWCDDFAAARNANLEKAQGEWYWQLDADEYLAENIDELIAFFSSGECDNYAAATYVIKNFRNATYTDYSSFMAVRLYKNCNNIKYESPIHEGIRYDGELKNLTTIVNHYGYTDETTKAKVAKSRRNFKILSKIYENDPDDLRNVYNLIKQYLSIGEEKTGIKLLENVVTKEVDRLKNDKIVSYFAPLFYKRLAQRYNMAEKFEKTIVLLTNYLSDIGDKKFTSLVDIYMLYINALYQTCNYEETIKYCLLHQAIFIENIDVSTHTVDALADELFCFEDQYYDRSLYLLACSYIELDEYDNALQALEKLDVLYDYSFKFNTGCILNLTFKIAKHNNDFTLFYDMYMRVKTQTKSSVLRIQNIDEQVIGYQNKLSYFVEQLVLFAQEHDEVAEILATKDGDILFDYFKLVKADESSNSKLVEQLFEKFCEQPLIAAYSYVIFIALKHNLEIDKIVELININALPQYITFVYEADYCNIVEAYYISYTTDNVKLLMLQMLLYKEIINHNAVTSEQLLRVGEKLCIVSLQYAKLMYNSEMLTDCNIGMTISVCGFAYWYEKTKKMSNIERVRGLKNGLVLCDSFKLFAELILNEIEAKEIQPQSEFLEYAKKVKDAIYTFILNGELEQAKQILTMYKEINPTDNEIVKISGLINRG